MVIAPKLGNRRSSITGVTNLTGMHRLLYVRLVYFVLGLCSITSLIYFQNLKWRNTPFKEQSKEKETKKSSRAF